MANLSERLREGSSGLTAYCLGDEVEPVIDVALPAYLNSAADLIDRLTAEGLARAMCIADGTDPDEHMRGGQAQSFEDFGPRWQAEDVGTDYKRLAQALLTYITGETHD